MVVVALDIGGHMGRRVCEGASMDGSATNLDMAARSLTILLNNKLMYDKKDQVGLVLFGAAATKNDLHEEGDPSYEVRAPLTACTTLQNDDPNHLGLRCNVLPGHQMALNHLGSCALQGIVVEQTVKVPDISFMTNALKTELVTCPKCQVTLQEKDETPVPVCPGCTHAYSKDEIDSMRKAGQHPADFIDALIVAADLLYKATHTGPKAKKCKKRVFLVTNADCDADVSDEQLHTISEMMRKNEISLTVVGVGFDDEVSAPHSPRGKCGLPSSMMARITSGCG